MSPADASPTEFIRRNTRIESAPLVPELKLLQASEVVPLWQASEQVLAAQGLPPPYWAFAWAGGQALARYLLDHPETVAGRRVLDFAAGCGIAGLAAARAGAARVEASEIDPFAAAAIALNAELNELHVALLLKDLTVETQTAGDGRAGSRWDVILAGDVCYERPMAERVFGWLRERSAEGVLVLLGDPGRSYLPKHGLERVIAYAVQTSREIEDSDLRNAVVWRVLPPEPIAEQQGSG
jgi:predicted nicotinamide N-methyase